MSRIIPGPNEVVLRLYGVGLGDCFLLVFPGDPTPCCVVIDCGIAKGTPGDEALMREIVADIQGATGGEIDILAVTHEHHDHVSGFALAEEQWRKEDFKIKKVWLPWIEGGGREAADLREVKQKLNASVVEAHRKLAAYGEEIPLDLEIESEFIGDAFGARESMVVKGHRIARELGGKDGENLVFCEPGEVRKLPKTRFNAYVLGPPHYADRDKKDLVKGKKYLLKLLEDESEMYGYDHIGQVADGGGKKHSLSMNEEDILANTLACPTDDMHQPFDSRYRVGWDEGMLDPFFEKFYSGLPEWRQINNDWLESAADMSLRAGGFTNNISLVLAFEMPQTGRFLLFPGDAQVGNWLSWHEIRNWIGVDGATPSSAKLKAEELLNRVIFYKVGHHGSHNATIRDKGLEMMALGKDKERLDMVAYVPVSVPIAHDVMNYCPMPFYPVMKRLQDVTKGHVYLANGRRLEPNEAFPQDLPSSIKVTTSTVPHRFEKNGKVLEDNLPLFTEFVIQDQ